MAKKKGGEIYDTKAMAKFFGVTDDTVCDWCKAGKIPAFKIGKKWRVRVEDLRKMIDGKVAGRKFDTKQKLF